MGLAKLTASILTNLKSVESLENLLILAVEGFGDLPNLPFSEEWVKIINIRRKEGYQNGIGLKEYSLNEHFAPSDVMAAYTA